MERSIHSGGVGKALVMSFHFCDPNYELDKKAFDISLNSERWLRIVRQRFFSFQFFSLFWQLVSIFESQWMGGGGGKG